MACKTETINIGEHECSVTQWPADKSILTKFKLVKIFGSSLTSLVSKFKEKQTDQEQAEMLSDSLSVLFQNNSPEEIFTTMKSCVIGVAWDNKRITDSSFNEIFSGDDLMEVYKVFLFVLKVNYSNLFKGQLAESFLAKVQGNL